MAQKLVKVLEAPLTYILIDSGRNSARAKKHWLEKYEQFYNGEHHPHFRQITKKSKRTKYPATLYQDKRLYRR